ncbi:MAG: hypothetical protein R3280_01165 [Marinobacter sp.]|uniref:ribosome modulation factor n=1 Tax=Marinobacter sp. TaxID=50741 RepID=UPI00299E3840|nr:hypothetical protein [Marinobacter sp.]MDX1633223.1 hypothetical protein [Marinobacter sp.]
MARDMKLGWNVDALNKAYRQGLMAASINMARERCPYRGEVVIAAWEAGWEDGRLAMESRSAQDDILGRIA